MLSFKNVKISKNSNGVEVDFNIIGQEYIKAEAGQEYCDWFKKTRGTVQIDTEYVKDKVREDLEQYNVLNEKTVKNILTDTLQELQGKYDKLKNVQSFIFEIEEFTGNSVQTTQIKLDSVSQRENTSFLNKDFNIDDLEIEDNPFGEKLKKFLQRYKSGRYQDVVYIYNEISPVEDTEADECKYDLFGLRYEILDQVTQEDKIIHNVIPVQILCRIFNITPFDLFECAGDAFSRTEYERLKNN